MHTAAPTLRHIRPDPKRIAGISVAIAFHAALLLVLFTPATWSPPAERIEDTFSPVLPIIKETPPTPLPPKPIETRPRPKPQASAPTPPLPVPRPNDLFVPSDAHLDDPVDTDTGVEQRFDVPQPPAHSESLGVLFGPAPPYPMTALKLGIEGRVMLRIAVDARGNPSGGSIESSSGSRVLDNAALKFVLAHWRFEPATRDGEAVATYALVPVDFSLAE
jgi:protein TonB